MKKQDMKDLEQDLIKALKGAGHETKTIEAKIAKESKTKTNYKKTITRPEPGRKVVLSVRESWGGPRFRFEYETKELFELSAQIAAEKEARKLGYKEFVTITNEKTV